jgi:hypothetical protein
MLGSNVPGGISGQCLDPGIQEAGLGNSVGGGGWATQAKPCPPCVLKWTAVETQQRWRKHVQKVLPTCSTCDTAKSDG